MTTIRDVAKYAGVSVSTVSRYLNHHPDLNEETRARVERAVRELDYVPSSAARNVSRLSTRTVGLTIPDIQDSFFADNAYGVEQYLREKGYALIYGSLDRSGQRLLDFIRYAREMRLDGLIITPEEWSAELLDTLKRTKMPVVALRRRPPASSGIPCVDADHYQGAAQMVEYLTGLGHRHIAHIVLNTDIGRERLRGYRDAMAARGLDPLAESVLEIPANRTMDGIRNGAEAMKRLLKKAPRVTAVFASSDPIAIGAMATLREKGLRVPEDVSVCGSGDLEMGALPWFRLTTIAFERYALGRKAAELLLNMTGKEVCAPPSVLFETHLVLRESTRAV